MPEYVLSSNESVLYKGPVVVTTLKRSAELLLTNLNLIIQFSIKKVFFQKPKKNLYATRFRKLKFTMKNLRSFKKAILLKFISRPNF